MLSISFQRESVSLSRYLKGVPWNINGIGYRCGASSCQTLLSNPPRGLEFLPSFPSLGETSVIRVKKIWQSLHEQYCMPTQLGKGKISFQTHQKKRKILTAYSFIRLRNVATLYQNLAAGASLFSCFDLHFSNILVGVHAKKRHSSSGPFC